VTALAAGQRSRGCSVTVCPIIEPGSHEEHPFLAGLRDREVPIALLEIAHRHYHQERRDVARLIRSHRPDILHTHGYRADIVDAPVARRLGVPIVSTVHGFTRSGLKGRFYEMMQVRSLRRFDAVVAVSRPLGLELRRRGVRDDILCIHPNAWTPRTARLSEQAARQRLGIDPDLFHVGWVGRLSHEKAPDILVEALGLLDDAPWVASFVGDGPMRGRVESRCVELGIEDQVRWHGSIPDAGSLMSAFDLFVLSSRSEGTPIVLLEAMAAGVPIVVTEVGGVLDLVGNAAERVRSESPTALADSIRALRDDRARRTSLGRAGPERLQTHTSESDWLDGYDAIYEAAVGRRGRSRRRAGPTY
jgi:glycosyltransferase involved in cell wall biosynthesis